MKKYLIPAALIVVFAAPASAQGPGDKFPYILAKIIGSPSGPCVVTDELNPATHKALAAFPSEAEAKAAMVKWDECADR